MLRESAALPASTLANRGERCRILFRATEVPRQRPDRGVLEHGDDTQVRAHFEQALVRPEEEQRVAAEVEEVLVKADAVDLEQVLPDRGHPAFHVARVSAAIRLRG